MKFAEIKTIRTKSDEIISWYCYRSKIGENKIMQIKSYSANKLSKLTDMQIDIIKTTLREKNLRTHVTSEMITSDATAPAKSKFRVRIQESEKYMHFQNSILYIPKLTELWEVSVSLPMFNNDRYEFKSSGLCPGCEKEHDKGKVVGRDIKGSYYIKCRSLLNEKEIKINASSEMISSDMSQANISKMRAQSKPTYDRTYFHNKILDQYPNLYREGSSENFDYYGITDEISCGVSRETICPLCNLGHDDEEIEGIHPVANRHPYCSLIGCRLENIVPHSALPIVAGY
ncbi:hypothetical protein GLOIN_2v1470482 [Rhizophagus irregularis DAOM 181602=DAOM 197198]|uniref:Uncharacterized protein n=1 Tax=Rhizophagus irregularis (strain DAOM 181602 / DAOM 197198 / MUCL 43194) TaxID=747089 RepID=A0A2P4QWD7_RHIID|nr:hypothetical protein GLOIN_2v1470482 [Rhizophagus irregularis DAOM 181602=DAOM 197198]POG81949.1 hypothetical protein GLOIN_2v1470482 [Rhizophagus irregularis DAOM 181602=DAOM 197198]|eukprot:XP_025188815.1 hypothetical protein GLOIN_2v1470482 [Rhizophagus irregularis DAOM 181602=DAOM 197198]